MPPPDSEYLGRLLGGLVDVGDVVCGRVDEAGGELLELVARVHQRRRVRHEGERLHPVAEPVRGRFDVLAHALGQLGDDGGVRELIDVVCGERRLHVVGRGGPGPEHVGGELVATRVVGLQLVGRDGDLDALLLGFEDGLRERDVARDAVEQPLGILDRLPVRVLPEVARGQDVVIGVGRETVL